MMKEKVQLGLVIVLFIAGIIMLFMGFGVDPTGIIDNSVLIAFGEIATFCASVLGIDYNYKYKIHKKENE